MNNDCLLANTGSPQQLYMVVASCLVLLALVTVFWRRKKCINSD
ncbi:LPXTG cell wall anchor domain-containing protein [Candidatus Saccharibacteria bacterium]|nr:MAG: LPXTG cell wall anchor domain-containing protein [Candidatus Saccharibacteria bacterium]